MPDKIKRLFETKGCAEKQKLHSRLVYPVYLSSEKFTRFASSEFSVFYDDFGRAECYIKLKKTADSLLPS